MKRFLMLAALSCATGAYASYALAGDSMSTMSMAMNPPPSSKTGSDAALTRAEVVDVDTATGMVTLRHGELANIGMPAMTMAYRTKDTMLAKRVHAGEKVRVRVENIKGTPTIVAMVKAAS